MLVVIMVLLAFCLICSLCTAWLFCKHVMPGLRSGASSQEAKMASTGAAGEADAEAPEEEAEEATDMIDGFLDPAWLQGMDDAPDLEINPVLKHKVNEEKRDMLRRAAEEAGQGGGGNAQRGVPGAIARLGWFLDDSNSENKEAQKQKEQRRQMKNIEGYLARTYEADVTYSSVQPNTIAGGTKFNAVDVARRTEIERVGGMRESNMMAHAQKSRNQLANYLATHPGSAGKIIRPSDEEMG
jgi:hypothetical protein